MKQIKTCFSYRDEEDNLIENQYIHGIDFLLPRVGEKILGWGKLEDVFFVVIDITHRFEVVTNTLNRQFLEQFVTVICRQTN